MRKMRNDMKILIYTIISLSLLIILYSPQNVSGAQGPPPTWICLDSCEEWVNVAPGESGLANFTGLIHVDIGALSRQRDKEIESVLIRLRVNAGNWSAEIDPDEMFFSNLTNEESRQFSKLMNNHFCQYHLLI